MLMKHFGQAALLGTIAMLYAPAAQAGPIWSLDWQFGTNAVISNTGRSVIHFAPANVTSSTLNATATIARLTETSSALAAHPDPITNQNYGVYLKLTDLASHQTRMLWFSGSLSGSLSRTSSNLTNRFFTPTTYSNIHLGHDMYTVFFGPLILPNASNHFQGSLEVYVKDPPVAPEPSALVLGGLGLVMTGLGAWHRRRREQLA